MKALRYPFMFIFEPLPRTPFQHDYCYQQEISPIHNLLQLETLTVEEGKKLGIPNELVPSGPSVIHLYLSFLSKFPSINIDLERHWIPDQQASRCAICQANFTTLFRKVRLL